MPFKLKLKKTRQYKVVSKNLFVMSVELLDGVVVECTLGADSSGQDCLDNVCQRLVIDQPELFGLRYNNRAQQPRWVQLDRPLKRQLDKYAASHQLYLRVMYYIISGTSLITDEVTRYHYFLQLKNDLIEGRMACDCQQAVVLASYSRQAEYGNLDRERHTVEYLKNLLQFPKQMLENGQVMDGTRLAESGKLERLTAAVIQHHAALHNMPQAQAEEGYISACQQLSGYGQESFVARDRLRDTPVILAVCLTGIVAAGDSPRAYRWTDITNVINHKCTFSVECAPGCSAESASFLLPTAEDGKYVWRLCVLQHTFYMKHQHALLQPGAPQHHTKFQEHGISDSREELDAADSGGSALVAQRAQSTSCLELASDPLGQPAGRAHPHSLRALLPSYRAAPDYDTAIRHKYTQHPQMVHYGSHLIAPPKPLLYGSHPDIHRPVHYPDVTRHTVSLNRPPLTHDDYYVQLLNQNSYTPFAINHNLQNDLQHQLRYVQVYKPPPPYPSGVASNSTPDLAVASQNIRPRGYIDPHVTGSSPDLVSRRQYLGHLHVHSHGTYNNLNTVVGVPNPHVILDHQHASSKNAQKVYDDRGNVMYSLPTHRTPYQRHLVPQHKMAEAHEPIYENVPLPWQNEPTTIRDRAQSLTETDEAYKLKNLTNSHPSIANATRNNLPSSSVQINSPFDDSHYVNAQIIERVRNASVPKDLNMWSKGGTKEPDLTAAVDRLSLDINKNSQDTPYTSLSAHVSNNNTLIKSEENVTSISITDADGRTQGISNPAFDSHNNSSSSGVLTNTSNLSSGVLTNTSNLSSHSQLTDSTLSKSSVSSKEKKRRRWGVFMGRGSKSEVKSATLGRDRSKPTPPANPRHRWSTGLPKTQPLPPSITKETLCQLLERKMSEAQLSFAFEQIPKGRESGADMTTALLPENARFNGYSSEHLPYEDNRVRLNPSPDNQHGYINASHITMTVGSSQRFYVIARAPGNGKRHKLTSSALSTGAECALWWECVWQVGARVAALVSGDVKPVYLPEEGHTEHYGKMRVRCERRLVSAFGATSVVQLSPRDKPPRTVYHVHYTHWPDGLLVPAQPDTFLSFLSETDALRGSCAPGPPQPLNANAPLLVSCAGGAGRGGVALAAHLLLHTLDHNQELDPPRTVGLLHQQRANLIENVHQYRFLHTLLLKYLQQSRLI